MLHTARAWKQDSVGVGSHWQSRYQTSDPEEILEFADLSRTADTGVDTVQ
jgi:hypothetical protein